MTPHRTLVLVAHPDLESSRITAHLTDAVRDLDHVTVRDLSAAYPDRRFDAAAEQELLRGHDTIVWQFPWHWYSVPGVLKEWMDQVLTYGFAYGAGGDALHGKRLQLVLSTGGPEVVLRPGRATTASRWLSSCVPWTPPRTFAGWRWPNPSSCTRRPGWTPRNWRGTPPGTGNCWLPRRQPPGADQPACSQCTASRPALMRPARRT